MPGVPVKPMLAKPTNGISEVLDKVQDTEFTVEYKYDGERAQIHIMDSGKTVFIYRHAQHPTSRVSQAGSLSF
jgi:DNA ligase-1